MRLTLRKYGNAKKTQDIIGLLCFFQNLKKFRMNDVTTLTQLLVFYSLHLQ